MKRAVTWLLCGVVLGVCVTKLLSAPSDPVTMVCRVKAAGWECNDVGGGR